MAPLGRYRLVERALWKSGLVEIVEPVDGAVRLGEQEETVLRIVDERILDAVVGGVAAILQGEEVRLFRAETDHQAAIGTGQDGQFVRVAPAGAVAAVERVGPAVVGQAGSAPGAPAPASACPASPAAATATGRARVAATDIGRVERGSARGHPRAAAPTACPSATTARSTSRGTRATTRRVTRRRRIKALTIQRSEESKTALYPPDVYRPSSNAERLFVSSQPASYMPLSYV